MLDNVPQLVTDKKNCCCCKACANSCPKQAIYFKEDEYGFSYPHIDEKLCIKCGKCLSTCNFKKDKINLQEPLSAYAAINKNKKVLAESTSGGCFSALADIVLEKNGTVYGAIMDDDFKVKHIGVSNKESLTKLRGSKYVLSDIGFCYKEAKDKLEQGEYVLFSGTPCQIAALYTVLGYKNYDHLLTVDIVCHGTPSQKMFNKYIKYLEKTRNLKISKYIFRNKKRTWLRSEPSIQINNNQIIRIGKYEEFYYPCFTSGNINQEACLDCPYARRERIADFTMCDFWGFENANVKLNEKRGLSALMFNNGKSLKYLDLLNEKLILQKVNFEDVVKGNGCLNKPRSKGLFWDEYANAIKEDKLSVPADQYKERKKEYIKKMNKLFKKPYFIYKIKRFGLKKALKITFKL